MESSSSLLLCAGLLSTLTASSFSLSCIQCSGTDESSCKGSSVQCPPEYNACVATYEYNYIDGQDERLYRKYCGLTQMCSLKGGLTTSTGSLKMSSSCCFTSNCNPPAPVLPPNKLEKNGVSCMVCKGDGDKPCSSTEKLECTGDENRCILMMETEGPPPVTSSVHGCGTPGLCNVTQLDIRTGDRERQLKFSCNSADSAAPRSLFMLVLTPVLLIKVLG
ncbi:uncharacterized protein [Hyperolius riggenbachi]|uniref:uncharacterized protein n=1 Tax=Hyperolius riggenbachi TaxID=752182 RepID=UPI0035A29A98